MALFNSSKDSRDDTTDKHGLTNYDDAYLRDITGINKAEERAIENMARQDEDPQWYDKAWDSAKDLAKEEAKEFAKEETMGLISSPSDYKFGEHYKEKRLGKIADEVIKWANPRKRGIFGGLGVFIGFAFISYMFFAIWQGPAQLVVFSNYLRETHFAVNQYIMNERFGRVMVYAWTVNNPERRNLSIVGNKLADVYETKLKKAGIELEYNKSGRLGAVKIADVTSVEGQKQIQSMKEAGIPEVDLTPAEGSKSIRIEYDPNTTSTQFRRKVLNGLVYSVDMNNVSGAVGARLLRLRAAVDMHPLKNVVRDADEKILKYYERMNQSEDERIKNGVKPLDTSSEDRGEAPDDDTTKDNDNVNGDKEYTEKSDELKKIANGEGSVNERTAKVKSNIARGGYGVTAVFGFVCGLNQVGKSAAELAYLQVNLPLMREAIQSMSMGDQIKSGVDTNTDEVSYYTNKLYDPETNTTVYDTDSIRVNEGLKPLGYTLPEAAYPTDGSQPLFFQTLQDLLNATGTAPICNLMNTTIGGWAFTIAGIALSASGPVAAGVEVASEVIEDQIISNFISDILMWLVGDQLDTEAMGYLLGAYADTGAVMASNDSLISYGATKLTPEENSQIQAAAHEQQRTELSTKSMYARYFDIYTPNSFAASLAMRIPYPSIQSFGATISTLPQSISSSLSHAFASIVTPAASAAEYDYSEIVARYGFTVGEMNDARYDDPYENEKEIVDQLPELNEKYGGPCFNSIINPETGAYEQVNARNGAYAKLDIDIPKYCTDRSDVTLTRYRFYLADTVAAIAAACYEGVEVDGRDFCAELGMGDLPAAKDGSTFRVATLNVLGAQHTTSKGKDPELASGKKRMKALYQELMTKGVDVVGFQEMEQEQYDAFVESAGSTWAIHPSPAKNSNFSRSNSIAWNTSVFEAVAVDQGYQTNLEYFNGKQLDAPWVILRHKATGQTFYFKNTHDPVGKSETKRRVKNARKHKADALKHYENGEKAIVLGDFNSNGVLRSGWDSGISRDQLTYCIMTDGGEIVNSYDAANGTTGKCPTKKRFSIDHIYVTKNIEVNNWERFDDVRTTKKLTDHPMVVADIVVGTATAGDSSGWTWPIKEVDWPKTSTPIAECNLRYSDGTIHTGIDISVPKGTPVYAAANGTVSMVDSNWGAVNIATNETDSEGKKLYINYQHMSRTLVKMNDKVIKDQTIVGYSGNVGTVAYHLHFGIWTTNNFLSGHVPPGSSTGQAIVPLLKNPYDYMPKDGRNVNECQ